MDGTYRLPEAQLDRFLMQVTLGYPDHASEVAVLSGAASQPSIEQLPTIATGTHIAEFIRVARQIQVAPQLYDYLVRVVAATRELPEVRLGAQPARFPGTAACGAGAGRVARADLRAAGGRQGAGGPGAGAPADPHSGGGAERRSGADVIAEALATVPVPQAGAQG